jgi:flagellar basal-body rod protein FlgG
MTTSIGRVAATGLHSFNENMAVISNNMANMGTAGFKASSVVFNDLMYDHKPSPGSPLVDANLVVSGISMGHGSKVSATVKDFAQGSSVTTNSGFDAAIMGRGFYQVLRPDGSLAYTRAGSFQLNQQGELVTTDGLPVQPTIAIPVGATNFTISEDGQVSYSLNNTSTIAGTLQIADFVNPVGLLSIGDKLYLETLSSGAVTLGTPGQNGLGKLKQGQIEGSNVNLVKSMMELIECQRGFDMCGKIMKSDDEMTKELIEELV